MAIFASTTLGSSDPMKAYNIKALEKRQADMLAAMTKQGAPSVADLATPWQGAGYVVNQLADQMNLGRMEAKADAGRAALAGLIGQYKPDAPDAMATVGKIGQYNPELAASLMQNFHDTAKQTALFGHQDKAAEAKVEADKAAAVEAARVAEAAASDQAAKEHSLQQARARDQMILEQQKAEDALKKERVQAEEKAKLDASDPKKVEARGASETKYRQALTHIQGLGKAISILTDNPEGEAIYTGIMQNAAPGVSGVPGLNMFVDKAKAARTAEYNAIVGGDAIKEMSATLTGATTNFELQKFEQMRNNPNFTDRQRAQQLQRVLEAAQADAQTLRKSSKAMGGDPDAIDKLMVPQAAPVPGSNAPATPAAAAASSNAQDAAARAWLADPKNANDPNYEGVKRRLGVK